LGYAARARARAEASPAPRPSILWSLEDEVARLKAAYLAEPEEGNAEAILARYWALQDAVRRLGPKP